MGFRMTSNSAANLSLQQLKRAVAIKEQITALEAELNQVFGVASSDIPIAKPGGKRRRSTAVRAKMAAAQKARWAKRNGKPGSSLATRPRRKMSAKARASLSAAAKARWAKVKAAGKKS